MNPGTTFRTLSWTRPNELTEAGSTGTPASRGPENVGTRWNSERMDNSRSEATRPAIRGDPASEPRADWVCVGESGAIVVIRLRARERGLRVATAESSR